MDSDICVYGPIFVLVNPLIVPVLLDSGVPVKWSKFIEWGDPFIDNRQAKASFKGNRLWLTY